MTFVSIFMCVNMTAIFTADMECHEFADLEWGRRVAVASNREMLGEGLLHGGAPGGRQIEIADEKGNVLAVVAARDVLLEKDQPRVFRDDVTKSAPSAKLNGTGAKPESR